MPLNIIICGGGIGGLAAAGYLRAHHRVTVLERSNITSDSPRDDYGVSVVSNAYNLLSKAGILGDNLDMPVMTHIWARNARNEEAVTIDFASRSRYTGAPSVLVKRAMLQRELLRFATGAEFPGRPAEVVEGARVVRVDILAGKVWLEDGREFSGDVIVGADGIGSVARAAVLAEDDDDDDKGKPRSHDILAFMTKVPISKIQAVPSLAFLADPSKQAGLASFFSAAGPQSKQRILVYHTSPHDLQVLGYTDEKEFAAQFDTSRTTIIRGVSPSRVLAHFDGFHPDLLDLFSHDAPIDAWRIRDIPRLGRWSRGRAVLIGDAAHAVTPHAGHGANLTIEDAEALGYLLRDVDSDTSVEQLSEVFGRFFEYRRGRAEVVARRSHQLGGIRVDDYAADGSQPVKPEDFSKIMHSYLGLEATLKKEEAESTTLQTAT